MDVPDSAPKRSSPVKNINCYPEESPVWNSRASGLCTFLAHNRALSYCQILLQKMMTVHIPEHRKSYSLTNSNIIIKTKMAPEPLRQTRENSWGRNGIQQVKFAWDGFLEQLVVTRNEEDSQAPQSRLKSSKSRPSISHSGLKHTQSHRSGELPWLRVGSDNERPGRPNGWIMICTTQQVKERVGITGEIQ